jgi:hypothetical protein
LFVDKLPLDGLKKPHALDGFNSCPAKVDLRALGPEDWKAFDNSNLLASVS